MGASGVGNERLWGVKPHGLGAEEGDAEFRRVVALEPRGEVDDRREGLCVGFGETVDGEGNDFLPQRGDGGLIHAVFLTAAAGEAFVELLHFLGRALRPHGTPEGVGLDGRESCGVNSNPHDLFLKQRDSQRFC